MYKLQYNDVICFDTNIIIWGICGNSDPNNTPQIAKAKNLISECSALRVKVVIPSIVLAEVVSGCDDSTSLDLFQQLNKDFIVVPFDAIAAYLYAEMWKNKEALNSDNGGQKVEVRRKALKADFMIIATAKAIKAKCIYTSPEESEKFRRFAQGSIAVEAPPSYTSQLRLESTI